MTCLVTEADIQDIAEIGGERRPVRLDEVHAARTAFGQRMGHGLFTAGLVTSLLATRLPGPGGVHLSQSLQFLGPVAAGDIVAASVEVVELVAARRRARLFCECLVEGRPVLEGEAWVAVPGRG